MKQLLQSAKSGKTTVEDVPSPALRPGTVLVRTVASLVSAGTERTAVEFSKQSLLGKARARPDLVRQVVRKARKEGVVPTVEAALRKLDRPLALGYSAAGVVVDVDEGVQGIRVGDRVACAGAGYAVHAEVLCVPKNLVAVVPDTVTLEAAAFSTVAAIGLHGLRLAEVHLGESVVVLGLGLVGLLTGQMAVAAGATVLGFDPNEDRVELAKRLGIVATSDSDELSERVAARTGGIGVDAALVAAATPSDGPISQAAELCRDRGTVVVVGAVGMHLARPPFFQKELQFRVSRSYGPGRYDSSYEEGGVDYPVGYVRWTERRNMGAVLELMARQDLDVDPLITHRFPIERAEEAYDLLGGKGSGSYLGMLVTYPDGEGDLTHVPAVDRTVQMPFRSSRAGPAGDKVGVGLLGAGNFAMSTLLPTLKACKGVRPVGVCTATGASGHHAATQYRFDYATTEEGRLLSDPEVHAVIISTRHDRHAQQTLSALTGNKHVFCEKPLCLNRDELAAIAHRTTAGQIGPILTVGFNRRFAPLAVELEAFMNPVAEPLVVHYRVNAGAIPLDHWVHDPREGGGRIIGEMCHFVDFITFLTGVLPVRVRATATPDGGRYREDNLVAVVEYSDGSQGVITYVASGSLDFGKERCEVFGGGRSAALDDFRSLDLHGGGDSKRRRTRRQDKGHRAEVAAFIEAVRTGGTAPIPFLELASTSLVTFGALESLREGHPVDIDTGAFLADALGDA